MINKEQFDRDGFLIVNELFDHPSCDLLAKELSARFEEACESGSRVRAGLRNVLRLSQTAARIAESERIVPMVNLLLGGVAFPVRAIFFDKTEEANWSIPWHQDLAIAVNEHVETEGFGPWSLKEGVLQVKPTRQVLESIVTVRVHLDDCSEQNGALRVIPGSHLSGELSDTDISHWTSSMRQVTCELQKGGVLLMKPLLLHASSPALTGSHRRVLHIEYSATDLPNGLRWVERNSSSANKPKVIGY